MKILKDIFTEIESRLDSSSRLPTLNSYEPKREPFFIITSITDPKIRYSHNKEHLYSIASSAISKDFPNPFRGNLKTVFKRLKSLVLKIFLFLLCIEIMKVFVKI